MLVVLRFVQAHVRCASRHWLIGMDTPVYQLNDSVASLCKSWVVGNNQKRGAAGLTYATHRFKNRIYRLRVKVACWLVCVRNIIGVGQDVIGKPAIDSIAAKLCATAHCRYCRSRPCQTIAT